MIHHGENIAARYNEDYECNGLEFAIDHLFELWNDESWAYDCPNNAPVSGQDVYFYTHWTQIVWWETTHIGCALVCGCEDFMVENGDQEWNKYLVCQYGSTGNYAGERPFEKEYCLENTIIEGDTISEEGIFAEEDATTDPTLDDDIKVQPEVLKATSNNIEGLGPHERSVLSFVLALILLF